MSEYYIGFTSDHDPRSVAKHHGILGQKWGQKNGPPYPLDASDHSASEKKAGWEKSLGKEESDLTSKVSGDLDVKYNNAQKIGVLRKSFEDYDVAYNDWYFNTISELKGVLKQKKDETEDADTLAYDSNVKATIKKYGCDYEEAQNSVDKWYQKNVFAPVLDASQHKERAGLSDRVYMSQYDYERSKLGYKNKRDKQTEAEFNDQRTRYADNIYKFLSVQNPVLISENNQSKEIRFNDAIKESSSEQSKTDLIGMVNHDGGRYRIKQT